MASRSGSITHTRLATNSSGSRNSGNWTTRTSWKTSANRDATTRSQRGRIGPSATRTTSTSRRYYLRVEIRRLPLHHSRTTFQIASGRSPRRTSAQLRTVDLWSRMGGGGMRGGRKTRVLGAVSVRLCDLIPRRLSILLSNPSRSSNLSQLFLCFPICFHGPIPR